MRAAGLDFQARQLAERQFPEPEITRKDDVLFRIHEVGVCGTDRKLAEFSVGYPPEGESFLVLGHEALGQVVDVGRSAAFERGDWVVPMVRRACNPPCPSCARGRRDLCTSGGFRERGIFGLHGYFSEYALDRCADLVRVPAALADVAVLIEPLSVVEKAVETALRIHEPGAERALVLGAGPIGVLAAQVLRLRGLDAALHSLEAASHPRARAVEAAGIRYLHTLEGMRPDILIEATGSAEAAFEGLRRLPPLGVMAVLGSRNGSGEVRFLDMILNNQVVFGSVNASPEAFSRALEDLERMDRGALRLMIRRVRYDDFRATIPAEPGDAAKVVHAME